MVEPGLQAATVPVTLRVDGLDGRAADRMAPRGREPPRADADPRLRRHRQRHGRDGERSDRRDVHGRHARRPRGLRAGRAPGPGLHGDGAERHPHAQPAPHVRADGRRLRQPLPGLARAVGGGRPPRALRATTSTRSWTRRSPASEVDPGSDVDVHVVLRRFGRPEEVRVVPVHIPTHAAGEQIELRIEPGDEVDVEEPEARSMADMVRNVRQRFRSTTLVVSAKMPTRGLSFQGFVVRDLPASALDALQLENDSGHGQPFVTYDRQSGGRRQGAERRGPGPPAGPTNPTTLTTTLRCARRHPACSPSPPPPPCCPSVWCCGTGPPTPSPPAPSRSMTPTPWTTARWTARPSCSDGSIVTSAAVRRIALPTTWPPRGATRARTTAPSTSAPATTGRSTACAATPCRAFAETGQLLVALAGRRRRRHALRGHPAGGAHLHDRRPTGRRRARAPRRGRARVGAGVGSARHTGCSPAPGRKGKVFAIDRQGPRRRATGTRTRRT